MTSRRGPLWTAPVGVLLGLGVGIFASLFVGIIAQAGGSSLSHPTPAVSLSADLFFDLSFVGAALYLASTAGRVRAADFGFRRVALKLGVAAVVIGGVGYYVVTALYASLIKLHGTDKLPSELGVSKSTAALIGAAVFVCVVAPICEEFFFRGFIFGALRRMRVRVGGREIGTWLAAIITGIFFGAGHTGSASSQYLIPLASWVSCCAWFGGGRGRCTRAWRCIRSTTRSRWASTSCTGTRSRSSALMARLARCDRRHHLATVARAGSSSGRRSGSQDRRIRDLTRRPSFWSAVHGVIPGWFTSALMARILKSALAVLVVGSLFPAAAPRRGTTTHDDDHHVDDHHVAPAEAEARPVKGAGRIYLPDAFFVHRQAVTVPERRIHVKGVVFPYLPGQRVTLRRLG